MSGRDPGECSDGTPFVDTVHPSQRSRDLGKMHLKYHISESKLLQARCDGRKYLSGIFTLSSAEQDFDHRLNLQKYIENRM